MSFPKGPSYIQNDLASITSSDCLKRLLPQARTMELVQRWTKLIWNATQQFTVTKSFHLILRRFKLWSPFQLRVWEDGTPVQDVRFAKGMNVHDILTIFRCLNLGRCVNFCARLKPRIQMQTPHQRCGWPNTFPGRWYKSRILLHQCIPRHFDTPMTSMRPWEEPCIIWTDRCLDTQSQIIWETTAQESDWIQLASIWAETNSPTFLPHIQACLPLPNLRAQHRDNVLQGALIATQPSHATVINLIRISACSAWTDKLRETLPRTNDTPMDECDY